MRENKSGGELPRPDWVSIGRIGNGVRYLDLEKAADGKTPRREPQYGQPLVPFNHNGPQPATRAFQTQNPTKSGYRARETSHYARPPSPEYPPPPNMASRTQRGRPSVYFKDPARDYHHSPVEANWRGRSVDSENRVGQPPPPPLPRPAIHGARVRERIKAHDEDTTDSEFEYSYYDDVPSRPRTRARKRGQRASHELLKQAVEEAKLQLLKKEAEEAARRKMSEEHRAAEEVRQRKAEERIRIEREVREKVEAENRAAAAAREAEEKREKELARLAELALQQTVDKIVSLAKEMILQELETKKVSSGDRAGRGQFRVETRDDTATEELEDGQDGEPSAGVRDAGRRNVRAEWSPRQHTGSFANGEPRGHSAHSLSPSTESELPNPVDSADHKPSPPEKVALPTRPPPAAPSPPWDGINPDNQGHEAATSTSKTRSNDDRTSSRSNNSRPGSTTSSQYSSYGESSTWSMRKDRKRYRMIREELIEPVVRELAAGLAQRRIPTPFYERYRRSQSTTTSRSSWSASDRASPDSDPFSSDSWPGERAVRPRMYRGGRPRPSASASSRSWRSWPPPPSPRTGRRGSVDQGHSVESPSLCGGVGQEMAEAAPGAAGGNEPQGPTGPGTVTLELIHLPQDMTQNHHDDHHRGDPLGREARDEEEGLTEYETADEG